MITGISSVRESIGNRRFPVTGKPKYPAEICGLGWYDLVNPHPIIEDLYIYLRDKLFSRNSLALGSNTELHLVRLS